MTNGFQEVVIDTKKDRHLCAVLFMGLCIYKFEKKFPNSHGKVVQFGDG